MKLVCSQLELNSALQLVSRAVASRPTHPVLANVLLTADEVTSRLSLTGFDLNLGIQTTFSASVEKSGAVTLPARLLGEIVSRLSNDSPITLDLDEAGQQVQLTSNSSSYQMRGMPADDFPDLPLVESGMSLKITASYLVQALKATIFSTSSDEAKQLLTGVHLMFNGKSIEAAATDGHRLAVLNIEDALKLDGINADNHDDISVTLPSRSLSEVQKLLSNLKPEEHVSLFCDRGQVVFIAEDQVLTSRTLEGTYPNYSQLIPDEFSKSIEIDRRSLVSALERVAVLADQHNNVFKLTTNSSSEEIKVSADAQDVGSGYESLPAIIQGENITIAFNVRYVLDGIKAIDSDRILLKCNAPTTPAIISPLKDKSCFTYLVMPVQIRS